MPQSAQVPGGVVSSLQGRANVIPAGEKTARPLQQGDVIQPGDVILADKDAQIQITDGSGKDWLPRDMQTALAEADGQAAAHGKHAHDKHAHADHGKNPNNVDASIDALERGDDDAATAAGVGGGGGGSMSLGYRVDRVIETVSPQEFTYSTPDRVAGEPIGSITPASASPAAATAITPTTTPEEPPVNHPPKVVDPGNENFDPVTGHYRITTDEDKPVSDQVKATDPDGDPLTYAKGSDPAHGTVVVHDDGTWTYTPNKDYNGSDAFTVTVSDGKGGTATATIDIGITPVNDPPKVVDPGNENFDPVTGHYTVTTEEDKPVSGQVKATDVDGDELTFAKGSNPEHGSVVVNEDGTWTYTPAKDYNGSDSFTVTVSDGHGGTATATIDIGITPVNDPPKVVDPGNENFDPVTGHYTVTTEEDKPVSGQVKATDVDGDELTFAKGSNPEHGTIVVNEDGTWTYTPAKDYNGSDSFTVTVSDGHGGTATATIDIGITPVNDPPKVVDPGNENFDPVTGHYTVTTEEDKPVSGQVKATDVDGDELTFAKGSNPEHGSVVVNEDGTWTYTPAKDYNGSDSFTVTVSDGHGGTATATIDIGITPVNDPPKVVDPGNENFDPVTGHYTVTTEEDKPVSGQVKATDVDGDELTFAKGSNPEHGTIVVNEDGTWTYTPAKDYNGSDSFTVTVSDGHGGTATATIDIGITPVNDPPKVVDPGNENFDPVTGHYTVTTEEDKPVSGQVKATDVDGDELTFAKGSNPEHGSVVVNEDGTWTYTPAKDFNGSDSFTVTVSDGHGGTATATIDIGVNPVNDPPKVVDPGNENFDPVTGHYHATTDEDTPVSGQVKATDVDGDTLTFAKGADPAHGTVVVNEDGTWTYTPSKDYNGSDSFTVTVSDGHGGTATATVDVGITPVNDLPVIGGQSAAITLSEEALPGGNPDPKDPSGSHTSKEATGQLTVTDADGDHVSLTLSGPDGLTSGGAAVTWSGSGTPADPLVGSAGGRPILTATIDDQGHYKVTLQGPVDHPDPTKQDQLGVQLQVHADDGHGTTTSTLTVNIADDSPLSGAQTLHVDASTGSQNTNLMLIIDTSSSMKNTLADKTANGIKAAIDALIDKYDGLGDVKIQIVTFNDAGQGRPAWMTVAQAKVFVDTLSAGGGTNYDSALAAAKASFGVPGKLADGVNVSYFITDGQPNHGKAIDTGKDQSNWEKFLGDNHIDSYAIGTGSLTAARIANIEPIAYNGITHAEQGAVTLKTNQELTKYLLDSVPTIKSGTLASLAGADGLKLVESFTSGHQVGSSLDAATKILTITLQSGTEIKVNTLTGDFTMKQAAGGGDETFNYTIVDKDGDRGTGTLTLSSGTTAHDVNHAPTVDIDNSGHNILGLVDLNVNPLLNLGKEQHVAVHDVDNNLVRVDISVDQLFSLGSLLGDHSKLSLSLDSSLTHGLHITGNDTRHLTIESDTPGHTIDVTQVNQLLATLHYDPAHVFGIVGTDVLPQLTVKATDAAGLTDSKSMSTSLIAINVDTPVLASAAEYIEHVVSGNGTHQGSCDTDVFQWTLADKPTHGESHTDTITDFNCAARSAGGDVLDLRDLLHVDNATANAGTGTQNLDKLLNFLNFDTQSQPGSTVIHVSSSGGFHADASGHSDNTGCADQQHIVLSNVDIRSSLGLDAHANDHQIIAELVQRGKLLVDH
ncbi:MAG: retention module-containing protein [Aquabacterium sp.]